MGYFQKVAVPFHNLIRLGSRTEEISVHALNFWLWELFSCLGKKYIPDAWMVVGRNEKSSCRLHLMVPKVGRNLQLFSL